MHIRTSADLGKLIKAYRRHAKLSQQELAKRIGTTQDWISQAERGKPTAELGLVLRALVALEIPIDIPAPGFEPGVGRLTAEMEDDYPDIDAIAEGRQPR